MPITRFRYVCLDLGSLAKIMNHEDFIVERELRSQFCKRIVIFHGGPPKAAVLAKSSHFWEKMCSRFFHVFAESSSPSLARFSLREVGLISTLYVFGDAFWLPICKSGSSQSAS